MKKIKLIYNPVSGDGNFKLYLDELFRIFMERNITVEPYRTFAKGDAQKAAQSLDENYDAVLAAGGDGTVSEVACGLLAGGNQIPMGIIPWGTVNDLANFLKIPKDITRCCRIVLEGKKQRIDAGVVNDERFFVNVASAGFLTDVAYKTHPNFKNILGRLAYYVKGIENLPRLKPISVNITSQGNQVFEGNIYLILVLNSSSAGGFARLAPKAQLNDGKLDVVILKACPTPDLITTSLKIFKGQHLEDKNVVYFQTNSLTLTGDYELPSDIDGEEGPFLPINISVKNKALEVFVPQL